MKKAIVFVLALACVLGLSGCQKGIKGSEVYSFPEPTATIAGILYSQGQETPFEIDPKDCDPDDLSADAVIEWFYDLELTPCDKPESTEGAEAYAFEVDGEKAFTYENRGGNEAYVIIDGAYYKVSNPSAPPIN